MTQSVFVPSLLCILHFFFLQTEKFSIAYMKNHDIMKIPIREKTTVNTGYSDVDTKLETFVN